MADCVKKVFNVIEYGAAGDGESINTKAFVEAITDCADAGGGKVIVPAGRWLTGPIHFKSNVNLHIEKDSEILFSTDPRDYLPVVLVRWEGIECYNYSPLIYARDCENIAITGEGRINGQGQAWWPMRERQDDAVKRLKDAGRNGRAVKKRVFGTEQDGLRPQLIQPINCRNVLIEGVTIANSPFWNTHLVYCENVIVRGVKFKNPEAGPNADGVDIESCRNVLIDNILADAGDDAICIKSGRDEDGRRVGRPCENIIVQNCHVEHGHGAVVIGSEMAAGVRNVVVSDCVFNGTERGIRIKSCRGRGGQVEDVRVENVVMKDVLCPFVMNLHYNNDLGNADKFLPDNDVAPISESTPSFRNMHFSNITAENARASAGFFCGLGEMPIENITFDTIEVSMADGLEIKDDCPATFYGRTVVRGRGFVCQNVKNINFHNITISTCNGPAIYTESCEGVSIKGLKAKVPEGSQAVVEKNQGGRD